MPRRAPQPMVFGQQLFRLGPLPAVLREGDARSARSIHVALVDAAAGDKHQPAIGHDRQFWIAQVDPGRRSQQGGRFPRVSIVRDDDPHLADARAMILRFAKGTPPAITEADQIGKRVVLAAVPDLLDRNEFWFGRHKRRRHRHHGQPSAQNAGFHRCSDRQQEAVKSASGWRQRQETSAWHGAWLLLLET